jgi:hypothetical protein
MAAGAGPAGGGPVGRLVAGGGPVPQYPAGPHPREPRRTRSARTRPERAQDKACPMPLVSTLNACVAVESTTKMFESTRLPTSATSSLSRTNNDKICLIGDLVSRLRGRQYDPLFHIQPLRISSEYRPRAERASLRLFNA